MATIYERLNSGFDRTMATAAGSIDAYYDAKAHHADEDSLTRLEHNRDAAVGALDAWSVARDLESDGNLSYGTLIRTLSEYQKTYSAAQYESYAENVNGILSMMRSHR